MESFIIPRRPGSRNQSMRLDGKETQFFNDVKLSLSILFSFWADMGEKYMCMVDTAITYCISNHMRPLFYLDSLETMGGKRGRERE